jgi:hypothetical protein
LTVVAPSGVDGLIGAVVLGMSRSGTSAVAGSFAACGFHAGTGETLIETNWANPRGFFERREVNALNDEILAEAGGTWFCPPHPDSGWRPGATDRRRAQAALDRLIAEAGGAPVVLKDPRIGVLLDLWLPLIDGHLAPVLVIRDPLEVALSLGTRDGTPLPFALGIWELHLRELLSRLDGHRVTVAPYPSVVSPLIAERVVADAAEALAPDLRERVDQTAAGVGFDVSLRQNIAQPGSSTHAAALSTRQLDLWQWLAALRPGNQVLQAPAELLAPSSTAWALGEDERVRRDAVQQIAVLQQLLSSHENEIRRLQALVRSEQDRLHGELGATHAALADQQDRHEREYRRLEALLRSERRP